jgi:hypothetical protein
MLVYHFVITSTAILTPVVVASDGGKVLSPMITALALWVVALWLIVFRRSDFVPAERPSFEISASLSVGART